MTDIENMSDSWLDAFEITNDRQAASCLLIAHALYGISNRIKDLGNGDAITNGMGAIEHLAKELREAIFSLGSQIGDAAETINTVRKR